MHRSTAVVYHFWDKVYAWSASLPWTGKVMTVPTSATEGTTTTAPVCKKVVVDMMVVVSRKKWFYNRCRYPTVVLQYTKMIPLCPWENKFEKRARQSRKGKEHKVPKIPQTVFRPKTNIQTNTTPPRKAGFEHTVFTLRISLTRPILKCLDTNGTQTRHNK